MENENPVTPSSGENSDSNNQLVPFNTKNELLSSNEKVEEYFKRIRSYNTDSSENQVQQTDNWVGGDQVGRDKKVTHNYNFGASQKNINALTILLDKFKEERNQNPALGVFIEELDYYNKKLEGDVVGLEQKLADGKRESFVNYALRTKEIFHKRLYKYQYSEAAQKINYHLLALVESYFMNQVYPLICDETDPTVVNKVLTEAIVEKILTEQLAEEPLNYSAQDINGMLYFLTGNCHIKWTK